MKFYRLGSIATVLAFSGMGCLKNNNEHVKAASWNDEKQPPAGKDVKDAPAPRISANTHLASGRMLEQQNDLPGAIRQYERALAANPKLTEAHNRMGIAYQKMERLPEAEASFKLGVRYSPDSAMLHNNLGYCLLLQEKYDAAEREFRDSLVIAPGFERARMNLAIVLARTDRVAESVTEFGRVVAPEVAYYNAAVICSENERYSDAEDALRRALKINPKFTPAQEHLDRIAALAKAQRGPDRVHIRMAEENDRAGEEASSLP